MQLYLDMESALCGRLLQPAAVDKGWFQNDTYIYFRWASTGVAHAVMGCSDMLDTLV